MTALKYNKISQNITKRMKFKAATFACTSVMAQSSNNQNIFVWRGRILRKHTDWHPGNLAKKAY